jgi:hypothetical protein
LGAIAITAAGRPDYRHASQAISVLGEVGGHGAALMNFGGFLLYGILIVGLAVGIHVVSHRGPGDWLGPLLLLVYGVAYVGVAFAPCDPGCTGASPSTNEHLHFLLSRIIIFTSVAAPLVLFTRLAKDCAWASMTPALLILALLGYLIFLFPAPEAQFGTQQRVTLACTLVWVLALSWRLYRVSSLPYRTSEG